MLGYIGGLCKYEMIAQVVKIPFIQANIDIDKYTDKLVNYISITWPLIIKFRSSYMAYKIHHNMTYLNTLTCKII